MIARGQPAEPEPDPRSGDRRRGLLLPLRFEEALGAAALALIFLISFGNVVMRYFTNVSFAFTEELSVFLLVFLTFVGSASAVAKNKHIAMTALIDRAPARLRRVAEATTLLLGVAMFALILRYGGALAYDDFRFGMTSPGLGVPQWLYSVWLPVLSAFILLRLLERLFRLLARN